MSIEEVAAPRVTADRVKLSSLTWSVFVPMVLYGAGAGAAAPMFALRALELGASVGMAGLVVALSGLGMVLTDLPAGRIVARVGERGAIGLGTALGLAGVLAAIAAPNPAVLAVGMLLTGASGAVWGLARQTYIAAVVPPRERGRALSVLAGSHRLGFFAGPFLGAGLVHAMGPNGALWLQCATTALAGLAMIAVRDVSSGGGAGHTLTSVVVENRRVLGTLGSAALLTGAARAARQSLLPLWAAHIGLSPVTTSLIFGISGAVDVLLSYPAGVFMDRFGRRATGVPSMLCFGLGYAVLPFTHTAVTTGIAAVLLGLANGISNGLIMTVGVDVAPPGKQAEFLGAWRLTHDIGMFAGPLAIGAISALAVLGAASIVLAGSALAGAWAMYRWFPAGPGGVGGHTRHSGR
ncbi:MFS transporter [Nocardia shimofusensis]|uniref:MFS transporter n=1 Tax=Nocardia shimofusensis TaxID=228596 RepID=UPI0009FBF847|nr:MFS transporter [Nocardia shimofusensis]